MGPLLRVAPARAGDWSYTAHAFASRPLRSGRLGIPLTRATLHVAPVFRSSYSLVVAVSNGHNGHEHRLMATRHDKHFFASAPLLSVILRGQPRATNRLSNPIMSHYDCRSCQPLTNT